jgi:hypothetical protein
MTYHPRPRHPYPIKLYRGCQGDRESPHRILQFLEKGKPEHFLFQLYQLTSDWRVFARCWTAELVLHGKPNPLRVGHVGTFSGCTTPEEWILQFRATGRRTYKGSRFRFFSRMKRESPLDFQYYQVLKMLQEYRRGRLKRHLRSRNRVLCRMYKFEFRAEEYTWR